MNTNNTTKRFTMGRRRTPTNLEATKELKEKLEKFAEKISPGYSNMDYNQICSDEKLREVREALEADH